MLADALVHSTITVPMLLVKAIGRLVAAILHKEAGAPVVTVQAAIVVIARVLSLVTILYRNARICGRRVIAMQHLIPVGTRLCALPMVVMGSGMGTVVLLDALVTLLDVDAPPRRVGYAVTGRAAILTDVPALSLGILLTHNALVPMHLVTAILRMGPVGLQGGVIPMDVMANGTQMVLLAAQVTSLAVDAILLRTHAETGLAASLTAVQDGGAATGSGVVLRDTLLAVVIITHYGDFSIGIRDGPAVDMISDQMITNAPTYHQTGMTSQVPFQFLLGPLDVSSTWISTVRAPVFTGTPSAMLATITGIYKAPTLSLTIKSRRTSAGSIPYHSAVIYRVGRSHT
ncbi:hypothetical protein TWF730_002110 [Orbilia blumenaviensis]|uniref:Uncharacterized protein n=1 Tax=Orbilia blumenaviensis TaxID=1796055 RepID=A0AAV9UD05_9PEZI